MLNFNKHKADYLAKSRDELYHLESIDIGQIRNITLNLQTLGSESEKEQLQAQLIPLNNVQGVILY